MVPPRERIERSLSYSPVARPVQAGRGPRDAGPRSCSVARRPAGHQALLDAASASPHERRWIEVSIALGEAQNRAGDPAFRNTLLTVARIAAKCDAADALIRAAGPEPVVYSDAVTAVYKAADVGWTLSAKGRLPAGRFDWLVERLRELGARHHRSPGQVAIAWALEHPAITAAIIGFRSPQQVEGILGVADFRLSRSELAEINSALERENAA